MRLSLEQLPESLKKGLASAYLVTGDEPLLIGEAADAIRAAARAAGYADRLVFFIERGFDWDELRSATQSLSLFSTRRLFELRLPSGKPDKGAAVVAALASDPPPDSITLVLTDKLDKKAGEAPWVQAFQQKGVWITVKAVGAAELPGWITARAKRAGLTIEPAAAQLIADRVEGNLLAAKQELEKLSLQREGAIVDVAAAMQAVGDSARYNVYQLAEAASVGDAARAMHILAGLRGEGVEPTLILWALAREVRGLWQARERNRLRSNERGSQWNLASPPSPRSLARAATLPLGRLLAEAAEADRILKGMQSGNPWTALTGLVAGLAGALHQRPVSGRVAR